MKGLSLVIVSLVMIGSLKAQIPNAPFELDKIWLLSGDSLEGLLLIEGKEVKDLDFLLLLNDKLNFDTIKLTKVIKVRSLQNSELYSIEKLNEACANCLGSGEVKKTCEKYTIIRYWVVDPKTNKGETKEEKQIHSLCNGKGWYLEKCKKCKGTGKIH